MLAIFSGEAQWVSAPRTPDGFVVGGEVLQLMGVEWNNTVILGKRRLNLKGTTQTVEAATLKHMEPAQVDGIGIDSKLKLMWIAPAVLNKPPTTVVPQCSVIRMGACDHFHFTLPEPATKVMSVGRHILAFRVSVEANGHGYGYDNRLLFADHRGSMLPKMTATWMQFDGGNDYGYDYDPIVGVYNSGSKLNVLRLKNETTLVVNTLPADSYHYKLTKSCNCESVSRLSQTQDGAMFLAHIIDPQQSGFEELLLVSTSEEGITVTSSFALPLGLKVRAVCGSPDADYFAVATDRHLHRLELRRGQLEITNTVVLAAWSCIDWHPDGIVVYSRHSNDADVYSLSLEFLGRVQMGDDNSLHVESSVAVWVGRVAVVMAPAGESRGTRVLLQEHPAVTLARRANRYSDSDSYSDGDGDGDSSSDDSVSVEERKRPRPPPSKRAGGYIRADAPEPQREPQRERPQREGEDDLELAAKIGDVQSSESDLALE
jgi:hypothetical protein